MHDLSSFRYDYLTPAMALTNPFIGKRKKSSKASEPEKKEEKSQASKNPSLASYSKSSSKSAALTIS